MEENSKCIICRKHVPNSETQKHPTDRQMGIQQQTLLSWKKECAVTLCEVLLGTTSKPFYQYFRTGEFCSTCLDAVRDISFTWKQVKSLETRMNKLSDVIQRNLKTNYGYIEQKTKEEVVEQRISAAYNSSETEDVNFLDRYSYDEITEILHSAMSSHSFSAIFPPFAVKNEPPSFSGDYDYDSGMLPLHVKLEVDQEECNEMSDKSGDDCENVTRSKSSMGSRRKYLSRMADQNNISSLRIKRKKVNRGRILNKKDVSHNEYASADQSEDEEYSVSNDSESSESSSDNSWNAKTDDHGGHQKSQRTSAKSKRKMSRSHRDPRGRLQETMKLECPTCHKMISRKGFMSHKRTHTGEKPFICSECGKTFTSGAQLWRHSQKMHAKLNPNGKKIKNPSIALKAANELASRGRIYHCDMCSWKFTWKFRYLRHMKDTHLNKDIKDGDSFKFHYCDEEDCSLSFTSLSSLKTHISEAHSSADKNTSISECTICQRIFSQESSLESHITSHDKGNFGCDYCCSTFRSKIELDDHLPRHTIVFQLSMYCHLCEECGERFSDVSQLRKHIANRHVNTTIKVRRRNVLDTKEKKGRNAPKYFCNICQKAMYKGSPEGHMYTHTHPNGFQCSKCPEVLKTPKALKSHQRRVHNDKINKSQSRTTVASTSENKTMCHVCQQEVYTNSLEFHLQSHFHPNGFQCLKCPAIELSPELLQIHERISHPPLIEDQLKKEKSTESTERKGRKITCQVCQKSVWKIRFENHMYSHTHPGGFQCTYPNCGATKRTPKLLKYHQSLAHNKDRSPPNPTDNKPVTTTPRKYVTLKKERKRGLKKCETCGKTYHGNLDLRNHRLQYHPEEYQAAPSHPCKFCWNVFNTEEERNSHVEEMHRNFRCSFEGCGKRFSLRAKLDAHLNVHNNRKPYECPYCSKAFANQGNCHSHVVMVHTKHRSIRCKLCPDDIGFYVKKEFCKHVQRVHPGIPESDYMSILERKKPDVPVKVIHNNMLQ